MNFIYFIALQKIRRRAFTIEDNNCSVYIGFVLLILPFRPYNFIKSRIKFTDSPKDNKLFNLGCMFRGF